MAWFKGFLAGLFGKGDAANPYDFLIDNDLWEAWATGLYDGRMFVGREIV